MTVAEPHAASVLVVTEDDSTVRRVRRALRGTEFEGHELLVRNLPNAKREALRHPAVVLVGRLHGYSLSETVEALSEAGAPILALGHDDGGELLGVVRAGAQGYFPEASEGLPAALRAVTHGEAVLPRKLAADLFAAVQVRHNDAEDAGERPRLTAREWEVLRLLQEGHQTHVIARRLYVSPVTIRSHVHALLQKFHASDRAELVRKTQGVDRRRS